MAAIVDKPWTKAECTEQNFGRLFAAKATEEFVAYQKRMATKAPGSWYAYDYCMTGLAEKALKEDGSYYNGLPPKGFSFSAAGGGLLGKKYFHYIINPGILPADALDEMDSTVHFMDCSLILQKALYKTLLVVWGRELFNQTFAQHMSFHPTMSCTTLGNYLMRVMKWEQLSVGDIVFFSNHPAALQHNPLCHTSSGINTVCVQKEPLRVNGYGLDSEKSPEEMARIMHNYFQADPVQPEAIVTGDHLQKLRPYCKPFKLNMYFQDFQSECVKRWTQPLIVSYDIDEIRKNLAH